MRFFLFMLALLFCPQVWTSVYADDVSIALNDSNYYEISSAAQLKLFANKVNGGDSGINGVLTADIDLSTLGEEYWTPIGMLSEETLSWHQYKGKFNGQNHVVTGLVLRKAGGSGLFGYTVGANISNVVVSGTQMKTTADTKVQNLQMGIGSICGFASDGTVIDNCHSKLTDILYIVRDSTSQKDINYVGGIVGALEKSTVKNCSVDGFVRTDGMYVGGIAGIVSLGLVENCHLKNYSGGYSAVVGIDYVGGIAGYQHGRLRSNSIVGCTVASGARVKATSGKSDTVCGCDTLVTNQSVWSSCNGYYEIYNADHLKWFSSVVNGGNSSAKAKLMNDINMSKAGNFTPIGTDDHKFSGEFDGQGFTIDSLTIGGQKYAGLFGYVENGTVKNLTLNHPYMSTSNDYLGFIAGFITQNGGTIEAVVENCHVKNGTLDGAEGKSDYVGGLVGKADMSAVIKDCSFQGTIKPHNKEVGGIAGELNSGAKIYNSVTVGPSTVWGDNYVGGVVGYMTDDATLIDNCFVDQSAGTVAVHASTGNYSGLLRGYDKSGSTTNTKYNEGNLQYEFTGKKVKVGSSEASEMHITGVSTTGKGEYYAIVDIGTSGNYFTTEITNLQGAEELYFWDNCSNIAGTEACGWINMKIADYAFDSNFKSLKMYYKMFAGDDHCVMLRPCDVYPAGDHMFDNSPNAKVYVDAEYYDDFCNDSLWGKYKSYIVPVTWMRTEDVNVEYGARYAYDRNRDNTGSVVKVSNGTVYGSSQVHVIGIDDSYVNDNDGTLWIYQDIGQTYDYNTTKVWTSAFNGKDNLKQVKFQEITKSGSRASQDLCIAIGDSAFANCKNLETFEVALYSNEGNDHVEYIRPSQMPIGKGVFAGSTNVRIYVPRDLVAAFTNDTTYGWAQYKDLISEGDFGNSDWTEKGVVYSYYTSADGQTRYTNKYNSAMEELLRPWSAYYRNFSPQKILEYGNSSNIKYVFASGVDESKIADNGGKLQLFSDIGEISPNHYKTLALSASGFQYKKSIKSIVFEDIVANNYNTVTDFALVIPDETFKGCSNLKELSMFMLVTKGTNHYVGIKPSQVFIGERVFEGVDSTFRIRVLPEYYQDFITDANWSQYKNYIVAADYLPTTEKEIVRHGVTYDYATKVMNGMSTSQVVQMKSSAWNALIIGIEAVLTAYTGGVSAYGQALKDMFVDEGLGRVSDFMVRYFVSPLFFSHHVYGGLTPAGTFVLSTLSTLDAALAVGANTTGILAGDNIPVNYLINRTKKNFERSSSYAMTGQWISVEKITNVPHLYVKSVSDDNTAVTIYNDCGTSNDDYQTVAIAYDAFHNKTKLKKLEFKERYGEDSRSLASGLTIALPDSMFKGCTSFEELNLINYTTGAHSSNHCYKGLTPDNFLPMGDIFAGLDSIQRKKIKIVVGEEELQEFLDDDYWSQYKDMFEPQGVQIVRSQLEWSCNYALAYNKNTLPLRTTVSTHDIDHVMIYSGDDDELKKNDGLAALINDYGEWNNYKLDYVKNNAFKGNDNLKTLDICDTHTNVADVYTDFDVVLQDSAFAHCKNFTDLNLIYQVTVGSNHTESMAPSQFTLGKGVFADTPNLKIKFCLDQENAFMADTSWVKYKDKFAPCFFEPLDEKVGDILLDPYRFLTKLNDGTNFTHVDASRANPEDLKSKFAGTSIQSFDEFRAFGCCGLRSVYNGMFKGCSSLQSIILPDSITSIETDAFNGCSILRNLTIPAKVKTIEENAFTGSGITKFTVASSVPANIDAAKAFAGLDDSYIIYVPDSAVTAYKTAWAGVADHINGISQRQGLKVVTLTEAGTLAEKLGLDYQYTENLFKDNHLYGNYAQYDSLRIIGQLDGRDIGVLRYMGGREVENCDATVGHLKYLDLYDANLVATSENYTYNRGNYEDKFWMDHRNNHITENNYVDQYMFFGLDKLETVILPKTATRIKGHAFRGCTNLKYLVVGDDMAKIDDNVAGETNSKVALIMLSKKVPSMAYESFGTKQTIINFFGNGSDGIYDNSSKEEEHFSAVIVPESSLTAYSATAGITGVADTIITNFEDEALTEALKKQHVFSILDLPNVTDITGWMNGNNDIVKFDELYFGGISKLGDNTFTNMQGLQEVTLPYALTDISAKAFDGCKSLGTIYAFGSVIPKLEKGAFDNIKNDFIVWVPQGTEDAYRAAWPDYKDHIQGYRSARTQIREITLKEPNTLADSLNVTLTMDDEDVKSVGGNLSSITGLKISGPIGSKDVAVIRYLGGREPDNNQHVYTTSLKYLDLYDAVLKADAYDFKLDGTDRSIDNDNEIPKDMLANCDNLETVILPRTATKLCYEACYDMASLKTLVIGDDVTEIDDDALGDNKKLTDIIFLCSAKPKLDGDAFTDPGEGDVRKVERMYVRKELVNNYSSDSEYTEHTSQITTGFTDIDEFRAYGCKAIGSEDDLSGVTTIDGWFDNFPNLTKLDKLKKTSIETIGKNTLANMPQLEQIALPSTLASIDDGAFKANANLHWLDLSQCDSLKANVTKLGLDASTLVYLPESFGEQTADNMVYGADGALRCNKYNLTGKHDYDVPKAFTAKEVTFDREFAKDGKYTLTLPFAAELPSTVKAYALKTDDGSKMTFKQVSSIEAGKPYVLCTDADYKFDVKKETAVQASTTRTVQTKAINYSMTGALTSVSHAVAVEQKMLVMGDSAVWNPISADDAETGINAFTAYVLTSTTAAAKQNVASEFIDYETMKLNEAVNNGSAIAANNGEYVNASLKRTLNAGGWNTFCVPFNTPIKGTPLEGASVLGLSSVDGNVFRFAKVDSLKAGEPYLVKPAAAIVNPTFSGVKIMNTLHKYNGGYDFMGTYSPMVIDDTKTTYFLGSDGKLKLAKANTTMNGMRAYFKTSSANDAQMAIYLDDDIVTVIDSVDDDTETDDQAAIYSVDGIYMGTELDKLPSGVYIMKGKKIVK